MSLLPVCTVVLSCVYISLLINQSCFWLHVCCFHTWDQVESGHPLYLNEVNVTFKWVLENCSLRCQYHSEFCVHALCCPGCLPLFSIPTSVCESNKGISDYQITVTPKGSACHIAVITDHYRYQTAGPLFGKALETNQMRIRHRWCSSHVSTNTDTAMLCH